MNIFRVQSAAKINLTLDILGTRADGYHELASVVHTVGWWDDLEVTITDDPDVSLECNRAELAGDDNLCVRAVRMWREASGASFGARIQLEKRIPTGAGLGGGSGNAAAMIRVLSKTIPLPSDEIDRIAAKLGADVPLFLAGGAMVMEGIGERLTPLPALTAWVLIVKPEVSLSTPAIYRAWDAGEFTSRNDTPTMLEGWARRDLMTIARCMGNDLERAAFRITGAPSICIVNLHQVGALGAQMSGSGSACFGVFEHENEAREGESLLRVALAKDVLTQGATTFVAPLTGRGVVVTKSVGLDVAT